MIAMAEEAAPQPIAAIRRRRRSTASICSRLMR